MMYSFQHVTSHWLIDKSISLDLLIKVTVCGNVLFQIPTCNNKWFGFLVNMQSVFHCVWSLSFSVRHYLSWPGLLIAVTSVNWLALWGWLAAHQGYLLHLKKIAKSSCSIYILLVTGQGFGCISYRLIFKSDCCQPGHTGISRHYNFWNMVHVLYCNEVVLHMLALICHRIHSFSQHQSLCFLSSHLSGIVVLSIFGINMDK